MEKNLKKNTIWNIIGTGINAFASLIFMIIVTRINDVYEAGVFSFAFSAATLFNVIGTYAGRIYQVTERKNISNKEFLINRVIENLTEKLYNHRHLIVRDEARDIFNHEIIVYPDEELEKLILNLYRVIRDDMNLGNMKGLNIQFEGDESVKEVEGTHALIESLNIKYRYKTKKIFRKIEDDKGNIKINVSDENIGWVK